MTTYIVRLTDADIETIRDALDDYKRARHHLTLDVALEAKASLESVFKAFAARVPLEPATDDIQEEDGTV